MRIKNPSIVAALVGLWLFTAGSRRAGAQEIQWRTDYAAAAKEAVEKNRPMFLDVTMVPCINCTRLDTIAFRDPEFIKVLNDRFIAVKVDGVSSVVEVQGQRVQQFPALFFLATDGNVLAKHEGYTEAANLLQLAQQALGTSAVPKKEVVSFQASAKVGPGSRYQPNVWKGPRQFLSSSGFSSDPVNAREERTLRAREILVHAVDNYRKQQWLPCLEQTRVLIVYYPDLPESVDARQLANAIHPDALDKLSKEMIENLSQVYWELAQQKLRQGQTSQAIIYLEKIQQSCPGTRYAAPAQELLQRHSELPPSPTRIPVRITTR